MIEISQYLQKASEKCGYNRLSYVENKLPESIDKIVVFAFFGDLNSTWILSSFLFKELREFYRDKYFIFCGFGCFADLFPGVNEFWEVKNESKISNSVDYFHNKSDIEVIGVRNLNQFFLNVLTNKDIGFNKWFSSREINVWQPQLLSASILDSSLKHELESKGSKVALLPTRMFNSWEYGKCSKIPVESYFWEKLGERLLESGIKPVWFQNCFTYDMSKFFAEKCLYSNSKSMIKNLTALKSVGLALDVFNDFSRLAKSARTPYISIIERQKYRDFKEDLFNQLIFKNLDRKYIFYNLKDYEQIIDFILSEIKKSNFNKVGLSINEIDELVNYNEIVEFKEKKIRKIYQKGYKNGKISSS